MSLKYIGTFELEYNNEIIYVLRHITDYNNERIAFDYKNIDVIMFYNEENSDYYSMTIRICRIIDKLGEEGFEKFREYYRKQENIQEKYIVIDSKVYKPDVLTMPFGNLKYFIMRMSMSDEETFDGRSYFNQDGMRIEDKDEYSREKTLDNLRIRVNNYYQKNNVLPSNEHFLEKETKEYQNIINWLSENNK